MDEIKLLDLTRQYEIIKDEVVPVVMDIIESQSFVNGPVVDNFENAFAEFCGTKYAVGCSSGTDALLMSLIAMNIGCGDEVITVPFTFFATVEGIIRLGGTPVFVDIDEKTFNIDTTQIENAITEKTKAIIPVHLFGQCANMDEINRIAKKYNLKVIEDCAQAVGAEWNKQRAGSMGDAGCFSFFPAKNLGAFGDGGMVTTNDEELYHKMIRTRQHGIDMKNPYHYDHIGGNFRLDALQAGVLHVKLRYIESWARQRNNNAQIYNSCFQNKNNIFIDDLVVPHILPECYHVFNQYVIRSRKRDTLKRKLDIANIGCNIYYPYPIHTQECISAFGYKKGDFPITEKTCKEVLALPIYPELMNDEIHRVVDVIQGR
jgi:dTDP-4-amino-4,6-dideoxygalactose transaminase